ncbi:hypothetical protein, partial [uncultured Bifidobacterium sp.]|uniref:hypothetical protein n=1 Tax=uncultured Bifidobacterium sp. TaxID=165187 RepID=UPI00261DDF54
MYRIVKPDGTAVHASVHAAHASPDFGITHDDSFSRQLTLHSPPTVDIHLPQQSTFIFPDN